MKAPDSNDFSGKAKLRLNFDSLQRKQWSESISQEKSNSRVNLSLLSKRLGQIINVNNTEFKARQVSVKLNEEFTSDKKRMSVSDIEKMIALRKEGSLKFKVIEHAEPPDILKMNFFERNSFWSRKRDQSIESQRTERESRQLDECSFKPQINSHLRSKSMTLSKSKKASSYSQLGKKKIQQTKAFDRSQFKPSENIKRLIKDTKQLALNL